MCLAEYDEEEHISSEKEISFKKGVIQSKAGLIQRQMKKGLTFEESCSILSLTEDEISECKAYMDKHMKSK